MRTDAPSKKALAWLVRRGATSPAAAIVSTTAVQAANLSGKQGQVHFVE